MPPDVRRLFHELAGLESGEQARRLADASVDPAVRQLVEELLANDLETRDDEGARWRGAVRAAASEAFQSDHWIGATVGSYRLERLLGQGGMGAVYLGERSDGLVQHRAAIKLIQSPAPGLVERFLRERQILASLSHPHIAQLLDAGTLPGGIPYFALEYCDGEGIEPYCVRHGLGASAIVELLLPVCEAVHYAHQRLIVHRDLKPSNIMVSSGGVPKLLDFGIAKVLDDPHETQTVARMLTLYFASPEQIRGETVLAASDIYSLGAVLYRLLTGHYPYESAAAALAAHQPARPRVWQPRLDRDLENILLTALAKEPPRRYSSAAALADDLRRFLERRPVLATPPSLGYRAGRFLRRNPVASGAVALAILSMVAGTAVSVYQARQARQSLADIRQLANVFLFDIERSIRDVPGTLAARHQVVDTARRYLEKIAPRAGGDAESSREVADAYRSLAEVQYASNASRQGARDAARSLEASLAIRRQLGDARSGDPRLLLAYVETGARLCARLVFGGGMADARATCLEADRLSSAWRARSADSVEALMARQEAALQNGLLLEADGRTAEARRLMEDAYRCAGELVNRQPADREFRLRRARAGRTLSELLAALKLGRDSLPPAEAAAAEYELLLAPEPRNMTLRLDATRALLTVGSSFRLAASQENRPSERAAARGRGAAFLERALILARETRLLDPDNAQAADAFIVAAHRLARMREDQGRPRDAVSLYAAARPAIQAKVAGEASRRNLYLMGNNLVNTGFAFDTLGQPAEAAAALTEGIGWLRRTLDQEPNDAVARENLVSAFFGQAQLAEKSGDRRLARTHWRAAWAEAQTMLRRDATAKSYLSHYAELETMGKRLGLP